MIILSNISLLILSKKTHNNGKRLQRKAKWTKTIM